jgi:hypothetical protein
MVVMTEQEILSSLKRMDADPHLATPPVFTINAAEWPDNRMPFVQYHAHYLQTHKLTQPAGYLSNLKLMLQSRNRP